MFGIKSALRPTISSMRSEFGFTQLTHDNVDFPITPQSIVFEGKIYDYVDSEYSYGSSKDLRKLLLKYAGKVNGKGIHARFTSDSGGSLFGAWMLFIKSGKAMLR